MAKRRVVITGAAGYVGQRMFKELAERWDVVPIDVTATTRSGEKVPGLVEALRQEFSLPVEILNPFQRISAANIQTAEPDFVEQHAGQLAVAVGLALRSFEDL